MGFTLQQSAPWRAGESTIKMDDVSSREKKHGISHLAMELMTQDLPNLVMTHMAIENHHAILMGKLTRNCHFP